MEYPTGECKSCDALANRVAELEEVKADFERCFDLAQRLDALNPDAPGAFTGTVSERLWRAFRRIYPKIWSGQGVKQ